MEKELKIKAQDGKWIEGMLRGSLKRPLIILVHGLTGSMNEALHYNAARYFDKHGFSSVRINLYSWKKNHRKLHECTLETHGQDIDQVVRFLRRKGATLIFVVGHSYGFPSILKSKDKDFLAVTSWDGTPLPNDWFGKQPKCLHPIKGRILDEGYSTIMGEEMVREANKTDTAKLAAALEKPVHFVVTSTTQGNGPRAKKLYKSLGKPKKFSLIKNADHNFTKDGNQEELYKLTVEWCKGFL